MTNLLPLPRPLRLAAPFLLLAGALGSSIHADDTTTAATKVLETEGLVTFWTFSEEAGTPRRGLGPHPAELKEAAGAVERAGEGVFGPHSLRLRSGQWLQVPRKELGPLDIHGPQAQVSLLVWLKREAKNFWQSLAGVWDETHAKRQYMLFLNARAKTDHRSMEREPCANLVHGHISSVGGPTPGFEVCRTYASGGAEIGFEDWHLLALTYDGAFIRVYVDGVLDEAEPFNPFPYGEGIFDGGEDGAPFTVGANHVAGIENNNRFSGWIAGIAVFSRALDESEMKSIAAATLPRDW